MPWLAKFCMFLIRDVHILSNFFISSLQCFNDFYKSLFFTTKKSFCMTMVESTSYWCIVSVFVPLCYCHRA